MDFNTAVKDFLGFYIAPFKSFSKFTGRAGRREYWTFTLVNMAMSWILSLIGNFIDLGFIGGIFALIVFIPGLAVMVRRLHDVGKDGIYILWFLAPIVGAILILINLIKESDAGDNSFGENPKEDEDVKLY